MAIDHKQFGDTSTKGEKAPSSSAINSAPYAKGQRLMSTQKIKNRKSYERAISELTMQAGERPVVGSRHDRQVLLYMWEDAWNILSKSDHLAASRLFELQSNLIQLFRIMGSIGMLSPVGCSRAISASVSIAEYRFKVLAQELEGDEPLTIKLVKTSSMGQIQSFDNQETLH